MLSETIWEKTIDTKNSRMFRSTQERQKRIIDKLQNRLKWLKLGINSNISGSNKRQPMHIDHLSGIDQIWKMAKRFQHYGARFKVALLAFWWITLAHEKNAENFSTKALVVK